MDRGRHRHRDMVDRGGQDLAQRSYAGLRRIAEEAGVPLLIVECRCRDEREWRARVEARQSLGLPAHHTITWEGVRAFLGKAETTYGISGPRLVVDTARPIQELVGEVATWLGQHSSSPAPNRQQL